MALDVLDYEYGKNNELFRVGNIPVADPRISLAEIRGKLLDIVKVGYNKADEWGLWQHPVETRYGGRRTFTPRFGEFTVMRGLRRATIDQRLHIKFQGGISPDTIIHTERRVTAGSLFRHGTFTGFEIRLYQHGKPYYGPFLGEDPNGPSITTGDLQRGNYIYPAHEGVDPTYWNSAVAIIDLAHKEFVPQEEPVAAAN